MIILSEHDAMQRIIEGLKTAESGARSMMHHRPDQARGWELMAQTYKVCAESAWKLAEEAVKRSTKQ